MPPPAWPTAIFLLLTLWLMALTILVVVVYRWLKSILPKEAAGDLVRVLKHLKHRTGYFQHFSLVRFNPFSDTGGDQSFVMALLDDGGNGLLLTSLHGRGVDRFWAKKVTAGQGDQELSAEEKRALAEALKT